MFNDPSKSDPKDGDQEVSRVDALRVESTKRLSNFYLSPDGNALELPTTANVLSTFSGCGFTSENVVISPLEGSVWTFSYKGEEYGAQFNDQGVFTSYVSFTNSNHQLGIGVNSTPKVDPNKGRNTQLSLAGTTFLEICYCT